MTASPGERMKKSSRQSISNQQYMLRMMEVIVRQEEELAKHMQDHQNYLDELERVAIVFK